MTLGDIIKEYRKTQHLSMDAFSERSGISKAYISLLEKNKHPKTGKAIAPSVQCIKQAADGMNMDFNKLFSMIDGDVSLKDDLPDAVPELNARDERDIKKELDNIMGKIRNGEDGPLYYGDTKIDDASLSLLQNAFEYALRETKKENKVKYNPNKNKQ